ncbi:MAG: nidogen-like domain-containing protein [Paracoccaceae bacterium]|jgi:Ca2+-binding RTX toxin-like protein|nr:nidogen-like domain-containing protein [Paracoccaceae bacterium]MDP7186173.1 nidogen-like domain-containing protein [Paracoccaceae bacterium]
MGIIGGGQVIGGLGGSAGFGEIAVPRGDDGSFAVDVSGLFRDGFRLFGFSYAAPVLFINTNGTVSFGQAVPGYPTAQGAVDTPLLAPFWGDVDTRLDGEGAESGAIWADIDTESGIFTVTWDDVGVYRRNADLTNRFQLQIVDQGNGDFDLAFRYEAIGWTIGTAEDDTGAIAGIFDPVSAQNVVFDDAATLDISLGNTGRQGLWAFEVRDGLVSGMTLEDSVINGTAASDTIIAGDADDFIFGGAGRDVITGGFGADQINGESGGDSLTGSARADVLIGGAGDDFLNGGWGFDRLTGGDGADRFFHLGVPDHGSDWVTDYSAVEGDVLVFGGSAIAEDFIVQYATTEGAGADWTREAFVTYIPTGEILWALVDGEGEEILLRLSDGSEVSF